mgnify:CR=1 FL=1
MNKDIIVKYFYTRYKLKECIGILNDARKKLIMPFYKSYMGLLNVSEALGRTAVELEPEYLKDILNKIDFDINFQEYKDLKDINRVLDNQKSLPQNLGKGVQSIIKYTSKRIKEIDENLDEIIKLMFEESSKLETGTPFGVYSYQTNRRSGRIKIYLISSFLFCIRNDISLKPFLISTYAHELAHAYNHLGEDKDGSGMYWENFHSIDNYIAEGLAVFYEYEFAKKNREQHPDIIKCFEKTYKKGNGFGEEYYEGQNWDNTLEEVYISMIGARRQSIEKITDFRGLLEKNKRELRKRIHR